MARAEAMRVRLEASPFERDGAEIRVTISIGIAQADAEAQRIGGLMKRADQALYRAKRDGRNRVQRADNTPSHRREYPAASAA
jgi:diguanylate cyclase (GGDEF)-like protein